MNQYPFTIRKKANHYELTDTTNNESGYVQVRLNQKTYLKHRLIGLQFLPNPDPINFDVIDHLNHDRTDNRLQNIRWCSSASNSYNKSSHKGVQYEFIDDIPDDSTIIDFYVMKNGERREFETGNYYYYHDESSNEDKFFGKITDDLYKVLHINRTKGGSEFIRIIDINNKAISVMINRYKYQHNLL